MKNHLVSNVFHEYRRVYIYEMDITVMSGHFLAFPMDILLEASAIGAMPFGALRELAASSTTARMIDIPLSAHDYPCD